MPKPSTKAKGKGGSGKRGAVKRPPPASTAGRGRRPRDLAELAQDQAADAPAKRRKLKRGAPRPNISLPAPVEDEGESAPSDEDEGGVAADQAAAFVEGLNAELIAQSRATLRDEYRKQRPDAPKRVKARSAPAAVDDETIPEPSAAKTKGKGKGRAGESVAIDDLSEDDFALMGSGDDDDDDDLSVMSGFDGEGGLDISDDLLTGSDEDDEDDDDDDDLLGSEDGEADEWGGIDEAESVASSSSSPSTPADLVDPEDAYNSRKRRRVEAEDPNKPAPSRKLPIKLPDGQLVAHPHNVDETAPVDGPKSRVTFAESSTGSSGSESSEDEIELAKRKKAAQPKKSDPLGRRFGRPAVRAILEAPDPAARLAMAKEELATLGRDVVAEPENSLNLLRRLLSLCLRQLPANASGKALTIDTPIRAFALLSLLAVLLDIVPDYRFRELTDAEREAQVSQAVLRQRDWEEGLLNSYRKFLETCEAELKDETPLAPVALKCMCELLKAKTQFNFAVNLMDAIARHLGRSRWDASSRECLSAVIAVFRNDKTGADSLHLVRQLTKSIKARAYKVNPALLSVFLHLPLRTELASSIRASASGVQKPKADVPILPRNKDGGKRKAVPEPRMSKKARRLEKSKREITKELAAAELEVGQEHKQRDQTETLKLLFALYFSVIKLDARSAVLPAALEGLAKFAHLISVDFFRDLLDNLRRIMRGRGQAAAEAEARIATRQDVRERLLCIVTALALLSGQGEALNLDLVDFINELYVVLLTLAASPAIEERADVDAGSEPRRASDANRTALASESDLAFRALASIFVSSRASANPPTRTLAFAKRLLTCALAWPAESAIRAIELVRTMAVREPALEFMLTTGDDDGQTVGGGDGVYNPLADDPALCNPQSTVWWELATLRSAHYDERVRDEANKLAGYVKGE